MYGIANLDELNEPITGSSEAPEGIESLDKIAKYSEQFDSGQTSMFVFDATNRFNDNETSNIRDLPVMDAIDRLEQRIDAVESTNTTSIITFLKAVPVSIQFTDNVVLYEDRCGICFTMSVGKATIQSNAMYGLPWKQVGRVDVKDCGETWSTLPSIHSRLKFDQCS